MICCEMTSYLRRLEQLLTLQFVLEFPHVQTYFFVQDFIHHAPSSVATHTQPLFFFLSSSSLVELVAAHEEGEAVVGGVGGAVERADVLCFVGSYASLCDAGGKSECNVPRKTSLRLRCNCSSSRRLSSGSFLCLPTIASVTGYVDIGGD
jgi:hypothetical protein